MVLIGDYTIRFTVSGKFGGSPKTAEEILTILGDRHYLNVTFVDPDDAAKTRKLPADLEVEVVYADKSKLACKLDKDGNLLDDKGAKGVRIDPTKQSYTLSPRSRPARQVRGLRAVRQACRRRPALKSKGDVEADFGDPGRRQARPARLHAAGGRLDAGRRDVDHQRDGHWDSAAKQFNAVLDDPIGKADAPATPVLDPRW